MSSNGEYYLGFNLRDYKVIGEPERLGSFVVLHAVKTGVNPKLIFRSRETLLHNQALLGQILEYAPKVAAAQKPTLHVGRDIFPPSEGEPNLFMVEDYGGGTTLSDAIKSKRLPEMTALEYVHELLDALGEFHKSNLVYGAINPRFIFLVGNTGPRSVRLGGLFHIHPDGEQFAVGYSPEFTAPDLEAGNTVSDKTKDVYSVGMLAYRMLLEREQYEAQFSNAFQAASETDRNIAWQKYHREKYTENSPFVALDELLPDLAPQIGSVVHRMLNLASDTRFADAIEAKQALRSAIVDAKEHYRRRQDVRARGVTSGKPGSVAVVQGGRKGIGPVKWVVAASLLATAALGGYYQFVEKPRQAELAAFNDAMSTARERAKAAEAALNDARESVLNSAEKFQPQSLVGEGLASANLIFEKVRTFDELNTPEGLAAYAEQVDAAKLAYMEVGKLLADSRGEVAELQGDLTSKIGELEGVSLAQSETVGVLKSAYDDFNGLVENGELDIATARGKELLGLVETELGSQIASQTSAADMISGLKAQAQDLLGAMYPVNAQLPSELQGFIAKAEESFDANDFATVQQVVPDANEKISALRNERNAIQLRGNELVNTAREKIVSLEGRISLMSLDEQLNASVEDVRGALSQLENVLSSRDFDTVEVVGGALQSKITELGDLVESFGIAAEDKLAALQNIADRYLMALPEGNSLPAGVEAAIAEVRRLLDVGDAPSSSALGEEVIADLQRRLEEIGALKAKADGQRGQVEAELDAFRSQSPKAAELPELDAQLVRAGQATNERRYAVALEAYESLSSAISGARESLEAATQELNGQLGSLRSELGKLAETGAASSTVDTLSASLNSIDLLLGEGSLAEARAALDSASDAIRSLSEELSAARAEAEGVVETATTLLSDFEALRFAAESPGAKSLRAEVGKAQQLLLENSFKDVTVLLAQPIADFRAELAAASALSDEVTKAQSTAETQKGIAENAGAQGSAKFADAEQLLIAAKASISDQQFAAAIDGFSQAASKYSEAVSEISALADQFSQLKSAIQDRGQLAEKKQALTLAMLDNLSVRVDQLGENATQDNIDALSAVLGEVNAAIDEVDLKRGEAEQVFSELSAASDEISQNEFVSVSEEFLSFSTDFENVSPIMDDGAFVAALGVMEPLKGIAANLVEQSRKPPRMSCDAPGLGDKIIQHDGGTYDVSGLISKPRFRINFAERLTQADGAVTIPNQFCLQTEPVTYEDMKEFLSSLDPASVRDLPADLRANAGGPAPVSGLPRVVAERFAAWLSDRNNMIIRLPTVPELLVADNLSPRNREAVYSNKVWTMDNCTALMGVVSVVTSDPNAASAECRLVISDAYDDVFLRLLIEGPTEEAPQ